MIIWLTFDHILNNLIIKYLLMVVESAYDISYIYNNLYDTKS
jgi:hypothetical protein